LRYIVIEMDIDTSVVKYKIMKSMIYCS